MENVALPQNLSAIPAMIWTWGVAFLPRAATAIIILVVGFLVAKWAARIVVGLATSAPHVDVTIKPILASVIRYAILLLAIIAALGQLGVQTASLLAVLGAAGLAVGLALQGTLTNIAAGIMLLWLRPFRVGDYIELVSSNLAGTIQEMGLFACKLTSFDGIVIFAPNSTIWNVALRNHSAAGRRLIVFTVTVPPEADIEAARRIVTEVAGASEHVLTDPAPSATIDKISPTAIVLLCRFWARHGEAGAVQRSWPDAVRQRFAAAEGEAIKPSDIVRLLPTDADPSRLIDAF